MPLALNNNRGSVYSGRRKIEIVFYWQNEMLLSFLKGQQAVFVMNSNPLIAFPVLLYTLTSRLVISFSSSQRYFSDNRSSATCLVVSNQLSEKSTGNLISFNS